MRRGESLTPTLSREPVGRRAFFRTPYREREAGNFTLLGSVANLIVAEHARSEGMPISFWAYFKVGAPLTVATLGAGTAWLMWR